MPGTPEMPVPPAPWTTTLIWQTGVLSAGSVPGVAGECDFDVFDGTRDALRAWGKGGAMATDLPVYDPAEPHQNQDWDWDCSQESAEWCLRSWGRTPSDDWMEQSLQDDGVVTPQYGLMDASGQGMADWFNREYGGAGYGFLASNEASVTFDDVAAEAASMSHPLMIGGRAWCHWVGVRGCSGDVLLLANSAAGYMGVGQTLSRGQFQSLGGFSMVRLTHPEAEGQVPVGPPPEVAIDYGPWVGFVGSGLLEKMAEAHVYPVQSMSTWLPLGSPAADIEECMASDGSIFRWVLAQNRCYRYVPS